MRKMFKVGDVILKKDRRFKKRNRYQEVLAAGYYECPNSFTYYYDTRFLDNGEKNAFMAFGDYDSKCILIGNIQDFNGNVIKLYPNGVPTIWEDAA